MGSLCVPKTWKRKHNAPAHNKPRTKSAATLSEHWQKAELSSAGNCVFVLGLSGQWKMGALLSHRLTTAAVMLLRCGMRSWRWPGGLFLYLFFGIILKYSIYCEICRIRTFCWQRQIPPAGRQWAKGIHLLYMAAGQQVKSSVRTCGLGQDIQIPRTILNYYSGLTTCSTHVKDRHYFYLLKYIYIYIKYTYINLYPKIWSSFIRIRFFLIKNNKYLEAASV